MGIKLQGRGIGDHNGMAISITNGCIVHHHICHRDFEGAELGLGWEVEFRRYW